MKPSRALTALVLLAGCGAMSVTRQRQELSVGHVGCPPREIAISEETNLSWRASCHGQTYYCSGGTSIQCREVIEAAPPSAAEPAR